jgi:hypothetical protein
MKVKSVILCLLLLLLVFQIGCMNLRESQQTQADVIVYGGTSGGVIAATKVVNMGKSVILIEPGRHLGGLTSGGLGATDIGNKGAIGGMAKNFYHRIYLHYLNEDAWTYQQRSQYEPGKKWDSERTWWKFEPHVAESIFKDIICEAKVPVYYGERLDLKNGVQKEGSKIVTIKTKSGRVFRGKMFIDATYEGDLMAKAGVSYTVGRESNSMYGETLNGVQIKNAVYHQLENPVDPYVKPGDPSSGLLPCVHGGSPGRQGQGDHRVQAYNFRMCLTDVPQIRAPFPKPKGYNALRYELLLRYLETGWDNVFGNNQWMPNHKTDMNNHGGFSTDNIGANYDYPEADYKTREKIIRDHMRYQKGLMWTLANNPRVPKKLQKQVNRWGLSKDEFKDNGNWPHQIYVREARRMVSDYVMTEHNCRGQRTAPDPVGLAAYTMDSHNTQRYVDKNGHARNEGDIQVGGFGPYPISYRSIVPRESECSNLFVPVCLSASHIAFGSIRMEPVFMVLGQSAASAASMAIDDGVSVQKLSYKKLQERLLSDEQILKWK